MKYRSLLHYLQVQHYRFEINAGLTILNKNEKLMIYLVMITTLFFVGRYSYSFGSNLLM